MMYVGGRRPKLIAHGGGRRSSGLLLGPGSVSPLLTLTRAQSSTVATGTDTAGALVEYASADTPRWAGAAQRLLIETQRTNSIRNPRCAGAVAGVIGSGGALPTGWSSFSFPAGVSVTVVGTGTASGIPYVDVRISGTPGASGGGRIEFEAPANITATGSQAWTASPYVGLAPASGATTNATLQVGWIEYTAAIAFVQNSFSAAITPTTASLASQQWVRQASTAVENTARVGPVIAIALTSGAAVDFTLRIGAPQMEQGATVSSRILPPAGAPAASTRGQDFVTGTVASLFPSGAGTLLMACSLADASAGLNQTLAQIDDGSANNRILIRSSASGLFQVLRVTAGAAATTTGTAVSDATVFKCGMAWDGAGRVAASLNGAAAISVTGAPTSLATLRLGYSDSGALVQSGEFGPVRVLPAALSDADLAAAVTAL